MPVPRIASLPRVGRVARTPQVLPPARPMTGTSSEATSGEENRHEPTDRVRARVSVGGGGRRADGRPRIAAPDAAARAGLAVPGGTGASVAGGPDRSAGHVPRGRLRDVPSDGVRRRVR